MSDERRLSGGQFLTELANMLISGERVILTSEVGGVLGAFQSVGGLFWVLYSAEQAQRMMMTMREAFVAAERELRDPVVQARLREEIAESRAAFERGEGVPLEELLTDLDLERLVDSQDEVPLARLMARIESDPALRARLKESLEQARRGEFVRCASVEELIARLGLEKPAVAVSPDEVGGLPEKTAAVAEMAQSASAAPAATCEEVFSPGEERKPVDVPSEQQVNAQMRALQARLDLGLQTIGGDPWAGDPYYPFAPPAAGKRGEGQ